MNYSDVEGGWTGDGTGNIDDDPLFVDPVNGEFTLKSCSPAADAGDNTAIPPEAGDLDDDDNTAEATPLDVDLNDRRLDNPNVGDTGNGDAPLVDMGAYEFVPDPCPWDLNGDGVVDSADLAILLTNWGTDPGGPPDFNCDGDVGPADLAALLTNWGPCPESGGGDGGGGDSEAALEAAVMQLGFESVPACQAWLIAASDGEAFACGCILHALLAEHDD